MSIFLVLKHDKEAIFIVIMFFTVLLFSIDAMVVLAMNSIAKEVTKELFIRRKVNIVYATYNLSIFKKLNSSISDSTEALRGRFVSQSSFESVA